MTIAACVGTMKAAVMPVSRAIAVKPLTSHFDRSAVVAPARIAG